MLQPDLRKSKHPACHKDDVYGEHTKGIIRGSDAYAMRSVRSAYFLYIENLNYDGVFKNTVTNGALVKTWMEKNSTRANAYQKRPKEELYDVIKDPFNLQNLIADPKFKKVKSELSSKLPTFMKQQNDKGLATELDAISRQPKHQPKD